MSRQYVESNGSMVGGSSCSYASLSNYNNGSRGMNPPIPVPKGTTSGHYIVPIVPAFGAPGYGTLMHGATPSCSGFFNIQDAYKVDEKGNCNQKYVRKLCQ